MDSKELRKRFVSDYALPITILGDELNMWEWQLDYYHVREQWCDLLEGIDQEYDGDDNQFLRDYHALMNHVIEVVKNKPGYKNFIGEKGTKFINALQEECAEELRSGVSKQNIYNQSYSGDWYLSIDLKKANLQALYQFDPTIFFDDGREIGDSVDNFYASWIASFCGDKELLKVYIPKSKYLRQVVFGSLNPSRQVSVEKSLVVKALRIINPKFNDNREVVMLGGDEAVVRTTKEDIMQKIAFDDPEELLKKELGIYTSIKPYYLEALNFSTGIGSHIVTAFRKTFINGSVEYKGIPKHYYPQIYGLLNNKKPDQRGRDLMFYFEKEPVAFLNRLKPIE